MFRNFILDGDEMKPFQQYVAELLDNNVPVLIYAGDKDYICNWLGNLAWVNELEYSGSEHFAQNHYNYGNQMARKLQEKSRITNILHS